MGPKILVIPECRKVKHAQKKKKIVFRTHLRNIKTRTGIFMRYQINRFYEIYKRGF